MNTLSWIVIGVVIGLIALKNWDKIYPMFSKIKTQSTKSKDEELIILNKKEIEKYKKEKLDYLYEKRQEKSDMIEKETRGLRKEIAEIDMEIALIKENNSNEKRWFK